MHPVSRGPVLQGVRVEETSSIILESTITLLGAFRVVRFAEPKNPEILYVQLYAILLLYQGS